MEPLVWDNKEMKDKQTILFNAFALRPIQTWEGRERKKKKGKRGVSAATLN